MEAWHARADLALSFATPSQITRDRWIENWIHPEPIEIVPLPVVEDAAATKKRKAALGPSGSSGNVKGKKAKTGKKLLKVGEEEEEDEGEPVEGEEAEDANEEEEVAVGKNGLGSGYPSGESDLLSASSSRGRDLGRERETIF